MGHPPHLSNEEIVMQWEYCVTRINTEDEFYAQKRLDGLGEDGWELVWLNLGTTNYCSTRK